jgi:ribonuclease D
MSLSDILQQIKTEEGFQNADLNPEVINGRIPPQEIARVQALEIAKRQAKDNIANLRDQYDRQVLSSSVIVLVVGGTPARQKEFTKLATDNEALCVDADAFYRNLAARAESRMSSQRIINTHVMQEITDSIAQMISSLAPRSFTQYPRVPTEFVDSVLQSPEEVVNVVKKTARATNDIPLGIIWLERNVTSIAFSQKFEAEPMAVVVNVGAKEEVQDWTNYFMPRSVRVTVDLDKVATIPELLTEAKNELRRRSSQT